MNIKTGDTVKSDLDGLMYKVLQIGTRNELMPLKGVNQIGNAVILVDDQGKKQLVYEWEIEKLTKE